MATMNYAFYSTRAENLDNNSSLFNKYLEFLRKQVETGDRSEGTIIGYSNKVMIFLEDYQQTKIEKISFQNICDFIKSKKDKSDNTRDQYCAAIRDFFKFADNEVRIMFDPNQIDALIVKSKEKIKRPDCPLSISEINAIREAAHENGAYDKLYSFEMFLTYGLTLDEIVECTNDIYFPDEKSFFLDMRPFPIYLSMTLLDLIEEHPDLLIRKTRNWFQTKNKELGKLINRKNGLILADIYHTREILFPNCPKCNQRFPSTDEFWVLAIHENDPIGTKWLYCKNCVNWGMDRIK